MPMPWVVPTEPDAAELHAALDAVWPGAPIDVLVGAALPDEGGITIEGGQVVWYDHGEIRAEAPAGDDPATAVVFVRGWSVDPELADGGWVPALPEPVVVTPIEPLLPIDPEPPIPMRPAPVVQMHAGLRSDVIGPYTVDSVVGRLRLGVGPMVGLSAGLSGPMGAADRMTEADADQVRSSNQWQMRLAPIDATTADLRVDLALLRVAGFAAGPYGGVDGGLTLIRRYRYDSDHGMSIDVFEVPWLGGDLGAFVSWTHAPSRFGLRVAGDVVARPPRSGTNLSVFNARFDVLAVIPIGAAKEIPVRDKGGLQRQP